MDSVGSEEWWNATKNKAAAGEINSMYNLGRAYILGNDPCIVYCL